MISNKYKISRSHDNELNPEETLADSLSDHSVVEVPIVSGVFRVAYLISVFILAVFILRSFQLQIVKGDFFEKKALRNSSSKIELSSVRGVIYDAKGRRLVENLPVFNIYAAGAFLPKKQEDLTLLADKLSAQLNLSPEQLLASINKNKDSAAFILARDINKETALKVGVDSLAGIFVVADAQRHYPDGPVDSHLLGYTASVTQEDIAGDSYYNVNDKIGRFGLEAQYEESLRGGHREIEFKRNSGDLDENESQAGNDLFLNVDSEIQSHLYQSMASVFNSAGVNKGAAILQDPRTGAVLAMVSLPSFDPNIFENYFKPENSDKIARILENSNRPLFNRVISGRYSPGSTIKPLLALAGLKERVVSPSTTVFANGSITVKSVFDPNVSYTFNDWKVHGLTDIKKAIADSVDVYFYALGGGYGDIGGLGIDRISAYFKNMLIDSDLGIDLPGEISGFVPTPGWKEKTKGENWFIGDTYNISIGQGDLLVSPLWINSYIGSIANGGRIMRPYIVREIKNPSGEVVKDFQPENLKTIPFDQQTINIVKQGMRQTVTSGTATLLNNLPLPIAAKTGTAQITGHQLNSLFTVFGPYDNPVFTLTVLVESINQSQGLGIRVANDFLSWYLPQLIK